MNVLAYQNSASPVENLFAVLDFFIKIAGKPDGDGTTGFEINGTTIDYYDYINSESGEEKIGVDIKLNNGKVLYHCMRYRAPLDQLKDIVSSELCKDSYGPDQNGNHTVVCYLEQTMELEVEGIIDYCVSVIIPERSKAA